MSEKDPHSAADSSDFQAAQEHLNRQEENKTDESSTQLEATKLIERFSQLLEHKEQQAQEMPEESLEEKEAKAKALESVVEILSEQLVQIRKSRRRKREQHEELSKDVPLRAELETELDLLDQRAAEDVRKKKTYNEQINRLKFEIEEMEAEAVRETERMDRVETFRLKITEKLHEDLNETKERAKRVKKLSIFLEKIPQFPGKEGYEFLNEEDLQPMLAEARQRLAQEQFERIKENEKVNRPDKAIQALEGFIGEYEGFQQDELIAKLVSEAREALEAAQAAQTDKEERKASARQKAARVRVLLREVIKRYGKSYDPSKDPLGSQESLDQIAREIQKAVRGEGGKINPLILEELKKSKPTDEAEHPMMGIMVERIAKGKSLEEKDFWSFDEDEGGMSDQHLAEEDKDPEELFQGFRRRLDELDDSHMSVYRQINGLTALRPEFHQAKNRHPAFATQYGPALEAEIEERIEQLMPEIIKGMQQARMEVSDDTKSDILNEGLDPSQTQALEAARLRQAAAERGVVGVQTPEPSKLTQYFRKYFPAAFLTLILAGGMSGIIWKRLQNDQSAEGPTPTEPDTSPLPSEPIPTPETPEQPEEPTTTEVDEEASERLMIAYLHRIKDAQTPAELTALEEEAKGDYEAKKLTDDHLEAVLVGIAARKKVLREQADREAEQQRQARLLEQFRERFQSRVEDHEARLADEDSLKELRREIQNMESPDEAIAEQVEALKTRWLALIDAKLEAIQSLREDQRAREAQARFDVFKREIAAIDLEGDFNIELNNLRDRARGELSGDRLKNIVRAIEARRTELKKQQEAQERAEAMIRDYQEQLNDIPAGDNAIQAYQDLLEQVHSPHRESDLVKAHFSRLREDLIKEIEAQITLATEAQQRQQDFQARLAAMTAEDYPAQMRSWFQELSAYGRENSFFRRAYLPGLIRAYGQKNRELSNQTLLQRYRPSIDNTGDLEGLLQVRTRLLAESGVDEQQRANLLMSIYVKAIRLARRQPLAENPRKALENLRINIREQGQNAFARHKRALQIMTEEAILSVTEREQRFWAAQAPGTSGRSQALTDIAQARQEAESNLRSHQIAREAQQAISAVPAARRESFLLEKRTELTRVEARLTALRREQATLLQRWQEDELFDEDPDDSERQAVESGMGRVRRQIRIVERQRDLNQAIIRQLSPRRVR